MIINERMPKKSTAVAPTPSVAIPVEDMPTTAELECFTTIQAALDLKGVCEPSRLFQRMRKGYVMVYLDDNQRYPVAGMYLRGEKKAIEIYDDAKKPCQCAYNESNGIKSALDCVSAMAESVELYDGKRQPRSEQSGVQEDT